jgi:hypothetical protein
MRPLPHSRIYRIISALWVPTVGVVSSTIALALLSLARHDSGSTAQLSYFPVYAAIVGYVLSSSLQTIVAMALYQALWIRLAARPGAARSKHEGISLHKLNTLHSESRLSFDILLRPTLSASWLGSVLTQLACFSFQPLLQYSLLTKAEATDDNYISRTAHTWALYLVMGITLSIFVLSILYLVFAPTIPSGCLTRDTLLDTLSIRQEEPIWKHASSQLDNKDITVVASVHVTTFQGRTVPVLNLRSKRLASDVELGDSPGFRKSSALSTLLRRTSSPSPSSAGVVVQDEQSNSQVPSISPQSSIHYHAPDDFDNAARQYRIYSMPEIDIGISQR